MAKTNSLKLFLVTGKAWEVECNGNDLGGIEKGLYWVLKPFVELVGAKSIKKAEMGIIKYKRRAILDKIKSLSDMVNRHKSEKHIRGLDTGVRNCDACSWSFVQVRPEFRPYVFVEAVEARVSGYEISARPI